MIDLEQLKPILATLLDGREDGPDIIDSIRALDTVPATDEEAIAAAVAEKTAELNEQLAAQAADFNDRYTKAFLYGVEEAVAEVATEEVVSDTVNPEVDGVVNTEIGLDELLEQLG